MIRVEHLPAGDTDAGVALVLLDRREKRNALTPDMLGNLAECADLVHSGPGRARAVVLAGEGDAFCAGFDLTLCRDDPLVMETLLRRLSAAVRALRRLTAPVVVAAHGAAIAGGCALLGGADIVVTDAGAHLGYPVVRLGVSPAVTSPFLRRAVGDARCRERLLDPALIDGREAHRIGLAHECVDEAGQVRPRAMDIARALAAKPHHGMAATKRWLNELDGVYDDAMLDAALDASVALAGGREERARLAELWKKG